MLYCVVAKNTEMSSFATTGPERMEAESVRELAGAGVGLRQGGKKASYPSNRL